MKILAFDTAYAICSVGLLVDQQMVVSEKPASMQQGSLILPTISELLNSCSIQIADLDLIAFGKGPGSFTGMRIASSVAQGMAYAANKPLLGISSLAAIAQTAYMRHKQDNIHVCVDARMNQLYWGEYKLNKCGVMAAFIPDKVVSPDAITINNEQIWHGVGDGWPVYQNSPGALPISVDRIIDPNPQISAHSLLMLALAHWEGSGKPGEDFNVALHYLR